MSYKGTVKNGTVVLPPDADLPDGTEVEVTPLPVRDENHKSAAEEKSFADRYRKFIGVCEGPADLAENHDHYIHGAPKKRK